MAGHNPVAPSAILVTQCHDMCTPTLKPMEQEGSSLPGNAVMADDELLHSKWHGGSVKSWADAQGGHACIGAGPKWGRPPAAQSQLGAHAHMSAKGAGRPALPGWAAWIRIGGSLCGLTMTAGCELRSACLAAPDTSGASRLACAKSSMSCGLWSIRAHRSAHASCVSACEGAASLSAS